MGSGVPAQRCRPGSPAAAPGTPAAGAAPGVPGTGTRGAGHRHRSWQPRMPRAAPGVPRPTAGFSPPRKFACYMWEGHTTGTGQSSGQELGAARSRLGSAHETRQGASSSHRRHPTGRHPSLARNRSHCTHAASFRARPLNLARPRGHLTAAHLPPAATLPVCSVPVGPDVRCAVWV